MDGPKSNERRCHFTFRVTHTVSCPVEHFQIKWEQIFLSSGKNQQPPLLFGTIWWNVLKVGTNLPSSLHRAWVWTFEVISFQSPDEFWREIQFVLFFWRQRAFVHLETTELFLSEKMYLLYLAVFVMFWRFLCQNVLTNKSPCRGYTSFVCAVLRLAADAELKEEEKKNHVLLFLKI